MEGEDSVRTEECLRGRLLAERAASRTAKEEAANLGNKLIQLEMLLKQEAKSRSRAEKKLKSLMKKLESMNIALVSDESDYSGLRDKSDISSISSATSSTIKQQEEENSENRNTNNITVFETLESKENMRSQKNDSQNCLFSLSDESSTAEGSSISVFEANLSELKGKEHKTGRTEDLQQSLSQSDMCCDESIQEDDHQDSDSQVDDSMALVVVDKPQKRSPIDPKVLDATVKEVLDALRYAKEQLQFSMERRRMNLIGVG